VRYGLYDMTFTVWNNPCEVDAFKVENLYLACKAAGTCQ
jgi:hypothetical protein